MISSFLIKKRKNYRTSYSNLYLNYAKQCDISVGRWLKQTMSDTRKKDIIMATLELAANKGLGNVSMNMIADKVGIKKPSLYNPMAAKIVAEETDKMIIATKQLFYAMEVHKLLHFTNPDMSAVSFAMTIHGLMDYELDQSNGNCSYDTDKNLLDDYLKWFCEENAV